MFKHLIGSASEKVKNSIEKGTVRKFAVAIGDENPLFIDEAAGARSKYKRNLAPPTFPVTLSYGTIEGLKLPSKGLIHGEQSFHYEKPLLVGDTVYCSSKLVNYRERKGSGGSMGMLTIERLGETEEGDLIFSMKQVVIINEAVRKVMNV
ncbi:MaoC family dehydratase N-terminal domain-containing protein [Metabacillus hrfriensis]|uniref:MaoC family dehydratase N-terminal domain-containing protein n=1 Tax=Metabacillus hrfriensis TaxID=3048891 RepID=A0ACD4R5L9_9BACI|nr:MaoC family dehydratase N-terminal domain-containing protein [Metabacillus sp. CT-WN-B3]WHZ55754.1 MaoC family dehydratase N-terminal domain-containing protein [Metabacillus sp. CT-WN-B3]